MKKKQIQIDQDLFIAICKYFLGDINDPALYSQITKGLESKIDKLAMHDMYTQYKSASGESKEQARQSYLDSRGVPENYRW